MPRNRFLVAGDVWQQIRSGNIDPSRCGIADMWGDWFVRGDLALDVASLQKVELLPWEPFGIVKAPQSTIPDTPELLALVDHVAALTTRGDDASMHGSSRWRNKTSACVRQSPRSKLRARLTWLVRVPAIPSS